MYNGIISSPQNWRFTRANGLQPSLVDARCKVEKGAAAAIKTVRDTTASGARNTIFNAMVRFSLSTSAKSARSNIGGLLVPIQEVGRRHLQKSVFQRRVFEAQMGDCDSSLYKYR